MSAGVSSGNIRCEGDPLSVVDANVFLEEGLMREDSGDKVVNVLALNGGELEGNKFVVEFREIGCVVKIFAGDGVEWTRGR